MSIRPPRLASDATRQLIGSACMVAAAVVYSLLELQLASPAVVRDRFRANPLLANVGAMFWGMAVYGVVYVILTVVTFRRAEGEQLRVWLASTDPARNRRERILQRLSGGGATGYAVSVSSIAVLAVLVLVQRPDLAASPSVWLGAIATVVAAWAVVMTAFAVRYAQVAATGQGLEFPGSGPRSFGDFIYVAIQLSTTFATSDVSVTTSGARRLVSTHSVIAFAFNSVIVALLVSVVLSS